MPYVDFSVWHGLFQLGLVGCIFVFAFFCCKCSPSDQGSAFLSCNSHWLELDRCCCLCRGQKAALSCYYSSGQLVCSIGLSHFTQACQDKPCLSGRSRLVCDQGIVVSQLVMDDSNVSMSTASAALYLTSLQPWLKSLDTSRTSQALLAWQSQLVKIVS